MISHTEDFDGIEDHLGLIPQAARSSECTLITGVSGPEAFSRAVKGNSEAEAKLRGRTPFSLDRDRILFSDAFRAQDDKYHVLFFGKTRRSRNYTSHAVKAAHVARVVAGRLHLNADLTEAIVLGSKVGAAPFIHVARSKIPSWVMGQLSQIDPPATVSKSATRTNEEASLTSEPLDLEIDGTRAGANKKLVSWLPTFVTSRSPDFQTKVQSCFPVASNAPSDPIYQSGAQSYWTLAVNPFLGKRRSSSVESAFTAEAMYGVWRHSLVVEEPKTQFKHKVALSDGELSFDETNATYEAMVARYADDIAWTIENLAEAARVEKSEGASKTAFHRFTEYVTAKGIEIPSVLWPAIAALDPGRLYTYFIDDLVVRSTELLNDAPEDPVDEATIRAAVSMSKTAQGTLRTIANFLQDDVFKNAANRNGAAGVITETVLNILWTQSASAMLPRIKRIGRIEGWLTDEEDSAMTARLSDPIFRLQACVATLVSMSDRDLFELIGLES